MSDERTARLNGVPHARPGRVPPLAVRYAHRAAMKLGRAPGWQHPGAAGPTRVLVRVDEFPHYRALDEPGTFGTEAFERFHTIMRGAGVPYLVAGLPTLAQDPLDPAGTDGRDLDADEREMLGRLVHEGVEVALHGYDHRTRDGRSRRHSELADLDPAELRRLLVAGEAALAAAGVPRPRVFVPPFNRFDAVQWPVLAERYDVIGGGPESVLEHGHWRTPSWRGDAVYVPAYAPFYGTAAQVLAALETPPAGWVPVVLHWGWEAERGWSDLERLADRLAPITAPWVELLAAIEDSR